MIKAFRTSKFWARFSLRIIQFWPPYLGTGIFVSGVDKDFHTIEVSMKQRFYNGNIVGVHFGGSLYSMCDPFLMFIAMVQLGPDYVVWDKAAEIKFIRPGRGTVKAKFHINAEQIEEMRQRVAHGEKYEPVFDVKVVNEKGDTVAALKKQIYVKKKN